MEYNKDKVDEMMLAFLWLTMFDKGDAVRAWKGHNWEHLDRLHEKGYIGNPKSKAKSVVVTEEGERLAEELFNRYFGIESTE
ncbi:DUF6429 family protein [Fodinibius salsisoli]|uniref:DUF6429 domain-containing protein n=1 Tax=Fodinibius salsisoli TaxID=2820877 RepID=A0ABT3PST6_9BACT|nr:DUF6429 family protein [Fodinibius salsisoli]MCW9708922.1 hypothetical protein [Fodinibius salsisoli]